MQFDKIYEQISKTSMKDLYDFVSPQLNQLLMTGDITRGIIDKQVDKWKWMDGSLRASLKSEMLEELESGINILEHQKKMLQFFKMVTAEMLRRIDIYEQGLWIGEISEEDAEWIEENSHKIK